MTRTEHLERIKKRCESLIEGSLGLHGFEEEIAGWKAMIAAIDGIQKAKEALLKHDLDACELNPVIDSIISAWPEELL